MFIKKLEIHGFKSFQKRTKIVFHPGITAIIGPNGTGKSNIVDSILWVLGGKRLKSLRGERSDDIIFNGNTNHPPMSMADVTLSLGHEDEELNINHRVFRSGESEYRLNSKTVRLKDIQDTLWKKSVGEKDYFIIEQGSIGLFLSSKPIEKRVLLEEAAGTAFYKEKKRQAQLKIESSEQNLTRLEDIIVEIQKRINSLKRQALAAQKYRKLREKIREQTLFLFRQKIDALEKIQTEIIRKYQKCFEKEKMLLAHVKKEEKSLAEKRSEVWSLEKSIKEKHLQIFSLKSQQSQAKAEKDKDAKRIDFFEEKKSSAILNKKEFQQELKALDQQDSDLKQKLEDLEKTLHQKQKDMQKATEESKSFIKKLESHKQSIEILRKEYLKILSALTEIKNEKARFEKELELLLPQENRLKTQTQKELSILQQSEKKQQETVNSLKQEQDFFKEKQKSINNCQNECQKLHLLLEKLKNQKNELQQEKDKAQHHLHALQKLEEKEREIKSPEIPGNLGILADLIESDAQHTHLIDTFWKEETTANLIPANEFLKHSMDTNLKGNLLLMAPKENEEKAPDILSEPNVLGLLKSRVRTNSEDKTWLSHLRDAAIVKDIKSAVDLWIRFPSLNFISMQGDILLSSGLLKLGQKKEGLLTLHQEIKKLKVHIEEIDRKLSPLNCQIQQEAESKKRLEDKIRGEISEVNGIEKSIAAKEKESSYLLEEINRIQRHILLLKEELAILEEDKKAMHKKLESISNELDILKDNENSLSQRVKKEEIDHAEVQELNESKKRRVFELQSDINIIYEKIKNCRLQLQETQRRREIVKNKIASLENENLNSEDARIKLQENIIQLDKKISQLKKNIIKNEAHLKEHELLLKKNQSEQNTLEKNLQELKQEHETCKEERIQWEIKKAEKERDLVNLGESCWQELKQTLEEVKASISIEELLHENIEKSLAENKEKLQNFKAVNLMAEEEYIQQKKRYDFLVQQKTDLRESIESTKEAIKKIDLESKAQFLKAFQEVNKNFNEVFSLLFNGGHAELNLTDLNQPLESGIEITAQPPGKKLQRMSLLSGGEKSLTSLAFFFALFRYKPAPFCILDEVDAALDDINLGRFLSLMKKIKNQTQFIIITHNFKTMEVADYIYGTTMPEPSITSIYSVKLGKDKERIQE
ncbi:MAG: chromosome segregation protein SMC [Candidatus Aminicenantes bacterium]|nr:chromosome segregation protein SMC [Candidatus Aminicenantes bacterium]